MQFSENNETSIPPKLNIERWSSRYLGVGIVMWVLTIDVIETTGIPLFISTGRVLSENSRRPSQLLFADRPCPLIVAMACARPTVAVPPVIEILTAKVL